MKKFYFLLFLTLGSLYAWAQIDTEHWFAPMAQRANNGNNYTYLYLSTNETVPFYVKVESNKKVLDSVAISKGNPKKILLGETVMKTSHTDSVQAVIKKGLHVFGKKKFFANLRFSSYNHAEIITSKGRAGLGQHFFTAYAPFSLSATTLNYTIGVIATEDNTEVDIFGKKVTLNKGQSYIYAGYPTDNSNIGKEIIATKPIALTNGNYNGQYASTDTSSGSDILMDQAVPVERLGKEFILMMGNGSLDDGMESVIIIATEDGTDIYFNDETTPAKRLNKGEYFLMPSAKYRQKSGRVYNAYIRSTRNVYVYQLLSGSGTLAAGGFNYIPPLNCYLPKHIDELGFINENIGYLGNTSTPYYETHPTKLNIITQNGATVKLNGSTLNGVYGPYPVSGTEEWVTFMVPDVKGNITLQSDKAVTAGIAAGDIAVGYGGYFAGASSMPVITKSGDCYPGVTLEVDDTFDNYQWTKKNSASGLYEEVTGANRNKFAPSGPGEYKAVLGSINCGIIETPSFTVLNCTVKSVTDKSLCSAWNFSPAFSKSQQPLDPSKTKIITPPKAGTLTIANGTITYTPNAGFANGSKDSFTYYIEGSDAYPDSEMVTVNVTLKKFTVANAELFSCGNNGIGIYNLDSANITSEPNIQKNFYENLADAQADNVSGKIVNFQNYASASKTVYVTVISQYGCKLVSEIALKTWPTPTLDTTKYDAEYCDEDMDGSVTVKLSDITPLILINSNQFDVSYLSATGAVLPENFTFSSDTDVQVQVKNRNGCAPVTGVIHFKIKKKITLAAIARQSLCDSDMDGSVSITLSDYDSLLATGAKATYFESEKDARSKTNSISPNQTIRSSKTFYYRFENAAECPAVGALSFDLKQPKRSETLTDQKICAGKETILNAGAGYEAYLWSTGETTPTIMAKIGTYYVDLTYNGCTFRQEIKVAEAPKPMISSVEVDGKNATVHATNGQTPYRYSLDGNNWQASNVFPNLPYGLYTVYLQDSAACSFSTKEFIILNLVNTITPNGDGLNDVLDYSDLRIKKDVSITVLDRYGRIIFKAANAPYQWNGTHNGRAVSTGTYWYILNWTEPDTGEQKQYNSWVMVKNR